MDLAHHPCTGLSATLERAIMFAIKAFTIKTFSGALLMLTVGATTIPDVLAETVALNPDHPDRHTVVKGDTLWGISARFLRDPWQWQAVWRINPDIQNPHRIYPGDVVFLTMQDGQPVLQVEPGPAHPRNDAASDASESAPEQLPEQLLAQSSEGMSETEAMPAPIARPSVAPSGLPVVRLSPQVRVGKLEVAIPTIPMDVISPFLLRVRVVTQEEMNNAPYVVSLEEGRVSSGMGQKAYVRRLTDNAGTRFGVFHQTVAYRNPGAKKEDILGYEAIQVADARVERFGDPATLMLNASYRETLLGDRLLPINQEEINPFLLPRAYDKTTPGKIIAVVDGVSRIGQYQVVAINLGARDGVEPGHVFMINQAGTLVRDTIQPVRNANIITLPEERAGVLIVFRPFDRVSYALVVKAEKEIRLYDAVVAP